MINNKYRHMRTQNACNRCNCPLDAGEGRYCSDCLKEIAEEEHYAKKWGMTAEQVRDLKRKKLIIA